MKKILLAAAIALSYGTAYAGMYHSGPQNVCADCHTMHASMAHDYAGNATTSTAPAAFANGSWLPNQGAPNDYLLKGTETGVCVACHDGQNWAPDVVDANANSYVRSAGFLSAAGNGHTMGFTGNVPGGTGSQFGATVTDFTCVDCHSPHGKADTFRNLNPYSLYGKLNDTEYPRFYLGAALAGTNDVRINASYNTAGTFADHVPYYSNANVNFENGDVSKLDKYCGKCHGLFHNGAPTTFNGTDVTLDSNQWSRLEGTSNVFKRHPTRVTISRPAAGGFTVKVYKTATSNYVGCLSCHKAHGTSNPFGLFYATAANQATNVLDDTESGSQAGQSVGFGGSCSNCHGQAR